MSKNNGKRPQAVFRPNHAKTPKARKPEISTGPLCWRFSECDHKGEWAWTNLTGSNLEKVLRKFAELEGMNLNQLLQARGHKIEVLELRPAVQRRLMEIGKDEVDELYSLRINARQRVWCIREDNIMKILWWDPEHTVNPSRKKGT